MAIQIIFRVAMAFILVGFIAIVGLSVVYSVAYNTTLFTGLPSQATSVRDSTYQVYSLMPIALAFVIIIWAIWAVTRQQDQG